MELEEKREKQKNERKLLGSNCVNSLLCVWVRQQGSFSIVFVSNPRITEVQKVIQRNLRRKPKNIYIYFLKESSLKIHSTASQVLVSSSSECLAPQSLQQQPGELQFKWVTLPNTALPGLNNHKALN